MNLRCIFFNPVQDLLNSFAILFYILSMQYYCISRLFLLLWLCKQLWFLVGKLSLFAATLTFLSFSHIIQSSLDSQRSKIWYCIARLSIKVQPILERTRVSCGKTEFLCIKLYCFSVLEFRVVWTIKKPKLSVVLKYSNSPHTKKDDTI